MKRHCCWALLFSASLFALDVSQSRTITIDDVLGMEEIGAVQVDATGKRILFERIPSYEARANHGVDESRELASVYYYEVGSGKESRPLLEDSNTRQQWISGFSPGGTRVALYWLEGDVTRFGVFDFKSGKLLRLNASAYIDYSQSSGVWISEDEVVIPTLPDGEVAARPVFRRGAARQLARSWEDAWAGLVPTASVLDTTNNNGETLRDGNLLVFNCATGRVRSLAKGLYTDLRLSPGSKWLAAAQVGGLQHWSADMPLGTQLPYHHEVVLIGISGRSPSEVQYLCRNCEYETSTLQWNRRADALTFYAIPTGQHRMQDGRYYLWNSAEMAAVPVPHRGLSLVSQRERGWSAIPEQAVPFEGGLAMVARGQSDPAAPPTFNDAAFTRGGRDRVDWYWVGIDGSSDNLTRHLRDPSPVLAGAKEGSLFVTSEDAVWRVSRRESPVGVMPHGKRVVAYQPTHDPFASVERRLDQGATIFQSADDVKRPEYTRIDWKTGEVAPLFGKSLRGLEGSIIAISRDAKTAVLKRTVNGVSVLTAVAKRRLPEAFFTANAFLRDVVPATRVYVDYQLPSGRPTRSCAILPARGRVGVRAPVVISMYPGPHQDCNSNYAAGTPDPYEAELFAGLGYIVLFPDAPYSELAQKDGVPGGAWGDVVLPALDALIRDGYADGNKVGVFGISLGGMSVLSLLSETDRIKVAVASHSAANFSSQYGALPIARRMWPEDIYAIGSASQFESIGEYPGVGSAPWGNPDIYIKASPLFHADKIFTPLMLIHSDLDWGFPMEQFDEMFSALYRLGRPVQYVRYWGEGHGLASPANIRDMWRRLEKWYGAYLSEPRP